MLVPSPVSAREKGKTQEPYMRVLVIDDSRAVRAILKKTLTDLGYAVAEAGDGQQGLDRLAAGETFDLALVDWNMPVLDGLGFVRGVRADPQHAGMKLMMVTTEIEHSQVQKAVDAGANAYLTKPFAAPVLAERVQQLMASQ